MNVVCVTLGTRGDIQPYIALARALQERGHKVSVATHPWAASLASAYGVEHIPLQEEEQEDSMYVDTGGGMENFMKLINKGINDLKLRHKDIMEAIADCDLVIGHYAMGLAEAEILNKPFSTFAIFEGAIPKIRERTKKWKRENRMLHHIEKLVARPYEQYRRELGLSENHRHANKLTMLALTESLTAYDDLWCKPVVNVGFQFLPTPENYIAPSHVCSFLDHTDKPILVTLGSNAQDEDRIHELFKKITETINKTKSRALVQLARFIPDVELPNNICVIDNIPYSWLLPHVKMVIHHFGYGTVGEVLREALPSIAMPQAADQFDRAEKFYKLGLCPKPMDWDKNSSDEISRAISDTLNDLTMHSKLRKVSKEIIEVAADNRAVKVIENHFGYLEKGGSSTKIMTRI